MFSDYIENFLEMMSAERGASKNTIESYKRDLEQAALLIPRLEITELQTSHITDFIAASSKKYSKSSVCRKISAIKQYFQYLKSENLVKQDITRLVELPKKDKLLPNFLTELEIKAILAEAELEKTPQGLRMTAFIKILAGSGLRISEVISLKKSNIQSSEVNGKKHSFLLVRGKGDKERIAPLSAESYEAISEYLAVYENFLTEAQKQKYKYSVSDLWLFPSKGKTGHITRQQVANLLKNYAIKAGLDPEKVSPHVLRHSFATNILQKGLDLRVLQEILGHSDISTTQIYTQTNPLKMKNFIDKHHPLAKKS